MTTVPRTSDTITVPQDTSVANLDQVDFGIGDTYRAVAPIKRPAYLRWLNGAATNQQTLAVGWHIEQGINPLLDETLAGMGMQSYVVEHRTADKDGNTCKPYWRLHPCSLIVIAEGVLSTYQMQETDARTGIAFAWETELDEHGTPKRYEDGKKNIKRHKVLKMRAFVLELVQHGYSEWLPITLSGNIVDYMLEALSKQFEVLTAFYAFTGRKAPFYGFALPLAPAPVRKMVGPKDGQQSPIYPMLAQIPPSIGEDYLLKHLTPPDLVEQLQAGLLDATIIWSMEESERIRQGTGAGAEIASPTAVSPSPQTPVVERATGAQAAYVTQPQIDWITTHYCNSQQAAIAALCEHFGVKDLSELRYSQFQQLVAARQQQQSR